MLLLIPFTFEILAQLGGLIEECSILHPLLANARNTPLRLPGWADTVRHHHDVTVSHHVDASREPSDESRPVLPVGKLPANLIRQRLTTVPYFSADFVDRSA